MYVDDGEYRLWYLTNERRRVLDARVARPAPAGGGGGRLLSRLARRP
jgi:hypothetical protein